MSGTPPRVRFPRDEGFHAAVKRGARAYFDRTGRSRWGGAAMSAKTGVILGWFAGSYALLLLWGGASAWLAVALTVSIALATAGIGFSVMHDANHGASSPSAAVNRAWGLSLDLVGASSYLWRFKHNLQHHTYANIDGMDADIDAGPFVRLAPSQRLRAFHRWQHLYAWLLYGVLAVKWWFVDDLVDLVRGRIGTHPFPRPRGRELALLLGGKAVFVAWTLVVPVLVFRSGWPVVLFLLGSLVLGVVLSTVFQLAHAVPEAELHAALPGDQRMSTGWAEHQVRATVDFAPSNRLLGWYVGGLNFQVEHHLLPDVCHVHYPALAPLVVAACREHGIPHRTHPTLRAAIAAHHRFLRALGRPGRAPSPGARPLAVPVARAEIAPAVPAARAARPCPARAPVPSIRDLPREGATGRRSRRVGSVRATSRTMKVAFATRDGEHVNEQLRRAPRLVVYEVTAAGSRLDRTCDFASDAPRTDERIRAIAGSAVVFVSAIGPSAAARLASRGIRPATAAGARIQELLDELVGVLRRDPRPSASAPAAPHEPA